MPRQETRHSSGGPLIGRPHVTSGLVQQGRSPPIERCAVLSPPDMMRSAVFSFPGRWEEGGGPARRTESGAVIGMRFCELIRKADGSSGDWRPEPRAADLDGGPTSSRSPDRPSDHRRSRRLDSPAGAGSVWAAMHRRVAAAGSGGHDGFNWLDGAVRRRSAGGPGGGGAMTGHLQAGSREMRSMPNVAHAAPHVSQGYRSFLTCLFLPQSLAG